MYTLMYLMHRVIQWLNHIKTNRESIMKTAKLYCYTYTQSAGAPYILQIVHSGKASRFLWIDKFSSEIAWA